MWASKQNLSPKNQVKNNLAPKKYLSQKNIRVKKSQVKKKLGPK